MKGTANHRIQPTPLRPRLMFVVDSWKKEIIVATDEEDVDTEEGPEPP